MWKLVVSHLVCFYIGFFFCAFWVGMKWDKSEDEYTMKTEKEIARYLREGK